MTPRASGGGRTRHRLGHAAATRARSQRTRCTAGSRRRAQHLPQRARPPRRRRPRRPAGADLRQPGHRHGQASTPTASCATRSPGWRARCAASASSTATASSSTCRWCPRRVMAMLACARLGAVHSVVFGGFAAARARHAHRRRPAARRALGLVRDRGRASLAYKPLLDRGARAGRAQAEHCVILQRPQLEAEMSPGRDHDWDELVACAEPPPACRSLATDPLYILYTSGTTGQPEGRRARQRRPCRRAAWTHAERLRQRPARCSGRPPTSAGWSAIPTSSTRRC